jgi:hypothetical protein
MKNVLGNAQKMIYNRWPKSTSYDPLNPSKMNCPAPFFLDITSRYCYEKCKKKWRALEIKKIKLDFAIVPVWVCSNFSYRKKNKWILDILIVSSGANYAIRGKGYKLSPNTFFAGTIETTYVPYIGENVFYRESSLLLQMEYVYGDAYVGYFVDIAIVDMKVLEVKKMCKIQPEFEKPAIYVPSMREKIMPAVRTDDLPESLQKLLKKEFDSDCSTEIKFLNWHLDDCRRRDEKASGFFGIKEKAILPPEYKRMLPYSSLT